MPTLMYLNQLTHAKSNRAFRAAHASGTPTATMTWFSMSRMRFVSFVRGGPANLVHAIYQKLDSLNAKPFLTISGHPICSGKVLPD
jgi:hypothetical protein